MQISIIANASGPEKKSGPENGAFDFDLLSEAPFSGMTVHFQCDGVHH
jgi:hypothetical protein